MCEEAFEKTDGQCVPDQLSKQFVRKGKAMFTQEELTTRLAIIAQRIYADSHNNPYLTADQNGQPLLLECSEVGFTTAVVVELCRDLQCPIHVVWSNCKIESYVPLRPKCDKVCYIVYGDHAYFVDDDATKQHITRLRLGDPMLHSEFLVAKPARANAYARNINKANSAKGHFWARDLHETRYQLHSQGTIPRVLLNGLGIPKALQYKN